MTKPIVLLDLDDTILDFHKAEAIAISKTFTKLGIEPTDELIARYSTINAAQWKRLEKGEINREQVQVGRFEILFKELGIERSSKEAKGIYEGLLSQGHYFIPGAEQLLEDLKGKYRLFICSNGNAVVQEGRLNSSGIKPYFEKIFISEDIGFDKPSTEYFEHCFEKIHDFDRTRTIIIGDSLSSDIQGGINAGIKTCWFNPKGKAGSETVIPDFEIRKLDQVNQVLEQAFV
jgi:2-haloacid dehalogenase